jgi:hypothetical protein
VNERCDTCGTSFPDDPIDTRRYVDICVPCNRAAETFNKLTKENADAEYAYHELAHHVLLYGRPHREFLDCYIMQTHIDDLPVGLSQIHEMRTLALQGTAYMLLGWKVDWDGFVERSWWGLKDVMSEGKTGQPVVFSYQEAAAYIEAWRGRVSKRKAKTLARAIERLRHGDV